MEKVLEKKNAVEEAIELISKLSLTPEEADEYLSVKIQRLCCLGKK